MAGIKGVSLKPRYRKKDNLLEWKVWFTPYSGAKLKFGRVIAEGRKEAERKKDELKADFLRSNSVSTENGKLGVFDEARMKLMDGLKAEGKSKKYIQRCGNVYDRLFGVFERKGTRADKKKWCFRREKFPNIKSHLEANLSYFTEYITYYCNNICSPQGRGSELGNVKAVVTKLYRLGYIKRDIYLDVVEQMPTPEKNNRDFDIIPLASLDRLLEVIKGKNAYYYRLLTFIRWTGRRIEEVTQYKKVDLEPRGLFPTKLIIRDEIAKTEGGELPLEVNGKLTPAGAIIRESLRGNKTEYIFPNKVNNKCLAGGVWKYLVRWSVRVIGVYMYPHLFRKLVSTYIQGTSDKAQETLTGSKDIRVRNKHYVKVTDEAMSEVLAKLGWRG